MSVLWLIGGGAAIYLISRLFGLKYRAPHFDNPRKSATTALLAVFIGILAVSVLFFSIPQISRDETQNGEIQPDPDIKLPAQFDSMAVEEILPDLEFLQPADSALLREMAFVKDSCPVNDSAESAVDNSQPRSYYISEIFNLIIISLLILIPVGIALKTLHESYSTAGVNSNNLWGSLVIGLIIGLVAIFVTLVRNSGHPGLGSLHFRAFIYFSIVGLAEEFVYRGYLQTRMMAWLKTIPGWILTSIIMAMAHFAQRIGVGGMDPGSALLDCLALIPISLFFGYTYLRTGNIWGVGLMHAFSDWINLFR
nr:CPBP family intramembrane metalloprotease [candidate division Zixibacteria bacterium]